MTRFCSLPARMGVALFVFALCAASLHAAEDDTTLVRAEPEMVGISSARLRLLDTMLRQHVDDGRVAGLVAGVARHGRIVYLEAMGSQVLAEGAQPATPMREDSIFQIRSNTKAITSLAVMQLIEAGRIGLNDPVSTYIPSFADMVVFTNPDDPDNSPTRAPSRAVTIEDLLLNIGGLSHRDGALYQSRAVRSRAEPLDVLVEKIAAVPLMGDPGTRWIYSESTSVLARIVEIVSGQRFDDYLDEHVLRPLRMLDTAFHVPPEKVDRLARVYETPRGGGALMRVPEMEVPITSQPPLLEGSVGLVSTVPDYMRFLQAFLDGGILDGKRVLSEPLIAEMTRNHIPPELLPIGLSPQNPMLDVGWGYGFTVVIDEAKSAYGVNNGEFGWSGTLGTYAWADPETDMVAIIMLQIAPASAHRLPQKFKALVSQTPVDE
ncbi:MAG: serine hydrolase domain-containing protein [Pseudomonadota bacterium]